MYVILNDELYHHGIKGQRWGVRRFQNADGSLKPAGEKRYGSGTKKDYKNDKRESRKKFIDDLGKLKDKNDIEAVTKLAAEYDNRNKKIKDTYASEKKEAINEYSKVMDSYNRDMKKADEVWKQAQAKYDSLGPNAMSKIRAVRKGQKGEGSKDVKEYLALYDKFDNIADTAWERKVEAEKRLGKSVVKAYNKETKRSERAAKKEAKIKSTKDAVKAYQKAWEKSIEDTDAADDYYRETVTPLYNSLAKTKLGRVREVIKAQRGKGSKAANEYLKAMDKAIADRDKADEEWRETTELYKKTGKNKVSRVINNAKYNTLG